MSTVRFKAGDRVQISVAGIEWGLRPRSGGAVQSITAGSRPSITVLWDGLRWPQRFFHTFIEADAKDGPCA